MKRIVRLGHQPADTPNHDGLCTLDGLSSALEAGDLPYIKHFFSTSSSSSSSESIIIIDETNKRTPLMLAAQNGHCDVVEYLVLEAKCDTDAVDRYGMTAFMRAACRGQLQVLKSLYENHNTTNDTNRHTPCDHLDQDGRNATMLSAERGHIAAMKWLFARETRHIECDAHGLTLSMIALSQAHFECAGYAYLLCAQHYTHRQQDSQLLLRDVVAAVTEPHHARALYAGLSHAAKDSPSPLHASLRVHQLLQWLAAEDATLRTVYLEMALQMNAHVLSVWQQIVHTCTNGGDDDDEHAHFSAGLLLEEELSAATTATVISDSALDIALASGNVELLQDSHISRIMEDWWTGSVPRHLLHSYHTWTVHKQVRARRWWHNPSHLFRVPKFKFIMDTLSSFTLFVVYLLTMMHPPHHHHHHQGVGTMTMSEWLVLIWGMAHVFASPRGNRMIGVCIIALFVTASSSFVVFRMIIQVFTAFALADRCIMAFGVSESMGPLLIAIRRMMTHELVHFSVLFAFAFITFFYSFNITTTTSSTPGGGGGGGDNDDMVGFLSLVQRGLAGEALATATVDTHYHGGQSDKNYYATILHRILSSAFVLCCSVVLLNMLIASMATTLEQVKRRSASEFLFSRARLRYEYANGRRAHELPAPFNLLAMLLASLHRVCRRDDDDDDDDDGGGGEHTRRVYCAHCLLDWSKRHEHEYYSKYTKAVQELISTRDAMCSCGRARRLITHEERCRQLIHVQLFSLLFSPVRLVCYLLLSLPLVMVASSSSSSYRRHEARDRHSEVELMRHATLNGGNNNTTHTTTTTTTTTLYSYIRKRLGEKTKKLRRYPRHRSPSIAVGA